MPLRRAARGSHRGILIMHACMDTVTIGQPNDDSVDSSVVLHSKAVPTQHKH